MSPRSMLKIDFLLGSVIEWQRLFGEAFTASYSYFRVNILYWLFDSSFFWSHLSSKTIPSEKEKDDGRKDHKSKWSLAEKSFPFSVRYWILRLTFPCYFVFSLFLLFFFHFLNKHSVKRIIQCLICKKMQLLATCKSVFSLLKLGSWPVIMLMATFLILSSSPMWCKSTVNYKAKHLPHIKALSYDG